MSLLGMLTCVAMHEQCTEMHLLGRRLSYNTNSAAPQNLLRSAKQSQALGSCCSGRVLSMFQAMFVDFAACTRSHHDSGGL